MFFFLLLMTFAVNQISMSGVLLTFPAARFPPLDYLPDDLTLAPCGVPKPTKPFYTTMHIGNTYNVTWITPSSTSSSNNTYRIRLVDSDGLTVEQLPVSVADKGQSVKLRSPCEQCMLLVEQVTSQGKVFRSCADVNVVAYQKAVEECNQRGSLINATCQCDSGFTGNQCEHYAHCETNDDCLNDGVCVDQPGSLIKKRCFCSYGFFGQRCDQKFNSQNDNCFAYDELSPMDLPMYGMFNSRCFKRHDLSANDRIYSRRIENEVEVILDFSTGSSFMSIGWRPVELSTSCRLFPILEDTRGRSTDIDVANRREFVAKPVMPENNGFTEQGLKSALHPMDCVDVISASVKSERLFISDFYSRDRSTPLEDYWYDGEMSLSAAYGTQRDSRSIVMFRREMREFEPTDHPLGPNEIFIVWSKGEDGTSRGVEKLMLAEPVNVTFEPTPSNELAFGVKNVVHDRLEPMIPPKTTTTSTTSTTTFIPTTTSTVSSNLISLSLVTIPLLLI